MEPNLKRSFPRTYYEAPIQFAPLDDEQYFASRIYNFSKAGMYFEPAQPLDVAAGVNILMQNYSPGTFGPEAYRSYDAEVRWCRELSSNGTKKFGVGVQFLAKSHEMKGVALDEVHFSCSLCGELLRKKEMNELSACVYLCPDCGAHFDALPEGQIDLAQEQMRRQQQRVFLERVLKVNVRRAHLSQVMRDQCLLVVVGRRFGSNRWTEDRSVRLLGTDRSAHQQGRT